MSDEHTRRITFKTGPSWDTTTNEILSFIKSTAYLWRIECEVIQLHSHLFSIQWGVQLQGDQTLVNSLVDEAERRYKLLTSS